ncbi:MAG: UvrD-helicase domain-containing protein [Ottowia sp.]|nr:UvrD-helicase domain-containing protein [Ottowia sp.]
MHQLNSAQRAAVCALDGPCLVLAGAGSGKTRVITAKIAHLLEAHDYEARHIAAVTFTNKAAAQMRERVRALLEGKRDRTGKIIRASHLTVCTFHSLGLQILRAEAQTIGLKPQFSIFAADDCFGLIQEQLATADKQLIRQVQSQISLWKNNGVEPEVALAQASDEQMQQAALVYRNYAATLLAYQAVDFDDLIRLPALLLAQDTSLLLRWQNRLRYFLIDEYQDTNACQYMLVKHLAGGSLLRAPAFTAVGDDDQAIYGWRGATLDNLKRLQEDFPTLQVIKLEQNYRSTGHILTAANNVIARNPKLFEKQLWSEHGMGDAIVINAMNDEEHEAESVIFQLSADKFERRAHFRDFAILYRSNHQARIFEQMLRRERIPYVLSGGQSFFDKAEIKDICAYLRLLANEDDDPAFIRAITTPRRGVGPATLTVLGELAGQYKLSLFAACDLSILEQKLGARQFEPLHAFCRWLRYLGERAAREPAALVLDALIEGIGYESYLYDTLEARQAQAKWQNVSEFFEWLKRRGTQADADANTAFDNADGLADQGKNLLELVQTIALMSMLEGRDQDPDAVRLSTLHAAKGLEYPHVFLVGIEEGMLPHQRDKEEQEEAQAQAQRIEEERRLMYVGITRAQRSLRISWCKQRKRGGDQQRCEPSRFIGEMGLEKVSELSAEPEVTPQQRLDRLKALLQTPRVPIA